MGKVFDDVAFGLVATMIIAAMPWLIWQAFSLLYSFWQAMGVM